MTKETTRVQEAINYDDLEGGLKEYIVLLQKREFFNAHEVLEEAWHPLRRAKHPLKNLLKGLINGAIAFEHMRRDREDARRKATTVFASYIRHKSLCVEGIIYHGLFSKAIEDIERLRIEYRFD